MSDKQLEWQRKVIRDEYLEDSKDHYSKIIPKNRRMNIKKLLSAATPSNRH